MPTGSTVDQAIPLPNETTWSAAMPAAPTIGQTIGNVAQGIGQTAQNVAANPFGSVVNAAVSVIHELPRLGQAVDLGLPNPLAPRGSPGQKLATYWAQTDPSQPVNVRLGQALDLAQQDQAKLMDWSAQHADPTRGIITGIGATTTDVATDPTMMLGGIGKVPAIGAAVGGVLGGGYSLATGASPEQTAQNVETGANLGMLGGALGEGIANVARGVRGRLSATADAQNAIGGENNAVKSGGVSGEPTQESPGLSNGEKSPTISVSMGQYGTDTAAQTGMVLPSLSAPEVRGLHQERLQNLGWDPATGKIRVLTDLGIPHVVVPERVGVYQGGTELNARVLLPGANPETQG